MPRRVLAGLALAATLIAPAAHGQRALTEPPSGDNQKASVTQWIGLVKVRVDYSSPDVHGPDGADRTGKIWGELVPYGLHDLGFNDCAQCPWRAGANENTVFTVSHDVLVEGQKLAAGRYGLHMIADPAEWTIIFSRNADSWGSYSYDPAEDVLRVKVKPAAAEHHEWLTYEFTDRRPDRATCALQWEKLQVPFTISVPNIKDLYVEQMRSDLRGQPGFTWTGFETAAQYCLQNKLHLEQGLEWAQAAVSRPAVGQRTFITLTTLTQLQIANGRRAEAQKTADEALTMSGLSPLDVHGFARRLQLQGENALALEVFKGNAKKFPKQWPVNLGLARGYAETGAHAKAVSYAKIALKEAPDELNRKNIARLIEQWSKSGAAAASN